MVIGDDELLIIPFKITVLLISGLPGIALFLCLILSIILHWKEATQTHCNVSNWLPSVSAAVASYSPERYIWRFLLGLHATPRIIIAFASKNFLITSPLKPFNAFSWFYLICNAACLINCGEVIFLLLLSSVSSIEDYSLHKIFFITFTVCSFIYLYLFTWLFDYSGRRRTTSLGERSFQCKVLCTIGYTTFLLMSFYFYYRHNTYCEAGIYSVFALCEYAVIIFNILFHSTLYYDFYTRSFILNNSGSTYQYDALPLHNSYNEKRT